MDTTDNAVPGLTFNTTARVLSGTPTTAATTVLTYTVTDERGSTASDTVTVTVAAQVAVTPRATRPIRWAARFPP